MSRQLASMLFVALVVMLTMVAPTFAQDTGVINPNATITFPPPVYVVSGEFTIRGSANLPNMTNYFIEYSQMAEYTPGADPNAAPLWFPATLPSSTPVQDGILGVWDTSQTEDGVYALRLTVRVRGGQPVTSIVAPVRVENQPSPFAPSRPVVTQEPVAPLPTSAPAFDPTPRVTATRVAVNVRSGDSTDYPIVGSLLRDQTVPILGISNMGTGWYYIELPNGQRGWVSPTVVEAEGDFSNIRRIAPPPVPVTPTPVPTFTPASAVNLVAGLVFFDTPNPTCATPFTVGFDVANMGTIPSPGGAVSLVDTRAADGSIQQTRIGNFPIINPGTTYRVNIPLQVDTWYNENHVITLTIDPQNLIPEFNENDNRQTITYTLQRGACP
ncbi:MAG: SH3 domain-containing protein [Anaerolineae bacterium]|nr:SH3 domain-containing protein [Anaerolineae bacterium]